MEIPDWFKDRLNLVAVCSVLMILVTAWGFTYGVVSGRIPIENSSASLITASATATLTGFYALLTFGLLRESVKERRQRVAPTLVIDSGGSVVSWGPVVRNVGNGPALELTLCAFVTPDGPEETISGQHLGVDRDIELGYLNDRFGEITIPDSSEAEEYDKLVVEMEYISNTGMEYSYSRKKDVDDLRREREQTEHLERLH